MQRHYIILLSILFFFLITISVFSQTQKPDSTIITQDSLSQKYGNDKGTVEELELEIDGLLIDETRTKAGHDFYDLLFSAWEGPAEAKNYMIRISEKPFRANMTMLEVYVNDELVVNTVLQPRRDLIVELAEGITRSLEEYLVNYSLIILQIENEDQSGTGIY